MTLIPFFVPRSLGGLTIVKQAEATSTAETIDAPADIQAGDLLVLLDYAIDAAEPTTVIPTDFTSIVNTTNSSSTKQIASYKIADGSEASATLTGMTGLVIAKVLVVFRGSSAISTITASTPNAEITTGNPAAQSVTASAGTVPLIVFGCYGATGAIDPRTFTPDKDGETASGTLLYLAWRIDNATGQDTSIDMDDEGTNVLQSFYLEAA